MDGSCNCLACSHERRGVRVKRQNDGSLLVFMRRGGPTFPPMPIYVDAATAGVCSVR
jgi:hypothetical protein